MTYYKIRHTVTGLFSKGGVYVSATGIGHYWSKAGKVWTSLGVLRSHLTSHMHGEDGTDMSEWEVVEYEVIERAAKPIHEMVSQKKLIQMLKT